MLINGEIFFGWEKVPYEYFVSIYKFQSLLLFLSVLRDYWFSTYLKFSEKLTFITPRYAHVLLHVRR